MRTSQSTSLYFTGIIPNTFISDRVLEYKMWLMNEYACKKALSSPAHITIMAPQKLSEKEALDLEKKLAHFSSPRKQFNIKLNGIGNFERRTIYIKVEESTELNILYEDWISQNSISNRSRRFTPHLTIANRDIPGEQFNAIKAHLESLEIAEEFEANGITLFKHDGKVWQIVNQFMFSAG